MIEYVPARASGRARAAAPIRWRRLGVADVRQFQAHLLRLQPEDFSDRFMGARRRHFVSGYVRSLDWEQVIIVGCWVGRSLRGVAELHPIPGRRGELALSVERRFQRRGIGAELLRRVLLLARNRGAKVLELRCLVGNQRVRRLIGRFQGQIRDDFEESSGTIHVLPPNAATLIAEMAESADRLGRSLIRLWLGSAGLGSARLGSAGHGAGLLPDRRAS